jgi:hypothetical protein
MSHEKLLTFALRNGALMHVDEVQNGKQCGCICAACGAALIAKHGASRMHHFAHDTGRDCETAVETALHLAAKELLVRHRRIFLPGMTEHASAEDRLGRLYHGSRSIKAQLVTLDSVTSEVRLPGIIPDIVATMGGHELLIEIAVTHFVDETKQAIIMELGLSAIEINLSTLVDDWNWQTLNSVLVSNLSFKSWIYNKRVATLKREAILEAQAKAQHANTIIGTRAARIPGFLQARALLPGLNDPAFLERERARMDEVGPMNALWLAASKQLGVSWDTYHVPIDVPVSGELGFAVSRRVWQAALLAAIYDSQGEMFNVNEAVDWCVDHFGVRTELSCLLYKGAFSRGANSLLSDDEKRLVPLPILAVHQYLEALVSRRILWKSYRGYRVRRGK